MYSIEEFEKGLVSFLEAALKNKYEKMTLVVERTKKINRELTGIRCEIQDGSQRCGPVVYLEDVYNKYCESEEYAQTLEEVKNRMVRTIEEAFSLNDKIENIHRDKGRIFFHFIHTEQNRELLETLPHREFQDLSIVYRCLAFADESGVASAQIDYGLANVMGLDEEELYQLAYENTRRMFPPSVKPIWEVIESLMADVSDELISQFEESENEKEPLFYVVTNQIREKGAVSILYTDELQKLSEQLECDLYLLPSSLHEMLAVPENVLDLDTLVDMVHEVNQMFVQIEDRLSNQIYKYDRKEQSITQVTDTEHRMLVEEANEGEGMVLS